MAIEMEVVVVMVMVMVVVMSLSGLAINVIQVHRRYSATR